MQTKTKKTDWLPKEQFETEGTEVIGWLSSNKGFQDITTRLLFINGSWYWAETEELVRRPDLIKGCMAWPEPPELDSSEGE